jgi:hypothetical protein
MTTNHLAKLYDTLTPRERLPLIIAAGARGDEAEHERLCTSAPPLAFREPDYYSLARAMGQAVHYHLLTLLDLAARFWQWWGLWMSYGLHDPGTARAKKRPRRQGEADEALAWRAGCVVRYYASRFVAHVEGWKRFCTELHIDPEVQLNFMIGWETIVQTEKQARALAFTPEEAERFVRIETFAVEGDDSLEKGPVPVETVQELAEGWHVLLDKLVQGYGAMGA